MPKRPPGFLRLAWRNGLILAFVLGCIPVLGAIGPPPISELSKLVSDDGNSGDYFGWSVAISGSVLVVGARHEDGSGSSSGAAYVFERNLGGADNWGQVTKLTASDAAAGDWFGHSVSISGDLIVIGSPQDDDSGSAYLFGRNVGGADNWGQIKKIGASDAAANDYFGYDVSISGGWVVIGAYLDDDNGGGSGSAYLFERNAGGADNWGEVRKLTASDADSSDWFGHTVSIDVDTVVVGAHLDEGKEMQAGSIYVFERNVGGANHWGEVTKITAMDAGSSDWFGYSVSIHGDTVVSGAPLHDGSRANVGSAYVFERNVGGADAWGFVGQLTAVANVGGDWFGFHVSVSGDRIVAGAIRHDGGGTDSGSAFLFERNTGGEDNWGEVAELLATDSAGGDGIGASVSMFGDTAVAGAYATDGPGAAYLFDVGGCDWTEGAELIPSEATVDGSFPRSVAVSGPTAIVADPGSSVLEHQAGVAWVFERNTGGAENWGQVALLIPPDLSIRGDFGWDVAISGDTALVADPEEWAAYVFERNAGGANQWGHVATLTEVAPFSGIWTISVSISGDTAVVGLWEEQYYDADCADYFGYGYVYERNVGGANAWGRVTELAIAPGREGSVAISGDTIVAGASAGSDDCEGQYPGSVNVFERNAGGANQWSSVAELTASDAVGADAFGASVSISADTAVVGAWGTGDAGVRSGSAYVFERNVGGADQWGEVARLTASDAAALDFFGMTVSISGDTAVVGARYDDDGGESSGSAYVFSRNAGGADRWGQVAKLTLADATAGDRFGAGLSISGGRIVGASSGALEVRVFSETCAICGDGVVVSPEQCDDGNTEPTDGCSGQCRIENCDDRDGDGFVRNDSPLCPPGVILDCDDDDPATFPGATELCDGRDNDCDGGLPVDEADPDGDGLLACAVAASVEPYVISDDGESAIWDGDPRIDGWNFHFGDLTVLKATGRFTQEPGSNPVAARQCFIPGPAVVLPDVALPGTAAFFLITGVEEGAEGPLGTTSDGIDRPNDAPCP